MTNLETNDQSFMHHESERLMPREMTYAQNRVPSIGERTELPEGFVPLNRPLGAVALRLQELYSFDTGLGDMFEPTHS